MIGAAPRFDAYGICFSFFFFFFFPVRYFRGDGGITCFILLSFSFYSVLFHYFTYICWLGFCRDGIVHHPTWCSDTLDRRISQVSFSLLM